MRSRRTLCFLIVLLPAALGAQVQPKALVDWDEDDSARVAFLKAHGQAHSARSVIVWAPTDSLDAAWLSHFVDSLAAGVAGVRALVGGPYAWQRIGPRPIQFYLSPGRFISHADGRDGVFISLTRVRYGEGPFLHEAAHELLVPPAPFYPFEYPDSAGEEREAKRFPQWLSEGLPDYLAQTASTTTGFNEGDVFEIGGLGKVDSVCAARLNGSSHRPQILDKVGGEGRLAALFTEDRGEVAPVFYACSQSFTKYVVARVGLGRVVQLFPGIPAGTWRDSLERAAGEPLGALRDDWSAALGIVRSPSQ